MSQKRGFTLIELSIVLVIIGLIVGGILMGTAMIRGAEVRAQIAQIQDYKTAIMTFRNKYAFMPGDATQAKANARGFSCRDAVNEFTCGDFSVEGLDDHYYDVFGIPNLLLQANLQTYVTQAPNNHWMKFPPGKITGTSTYIYNSDPNTDGNYVDGHMYFYLHAWNAANFSVPGLTGPDAFSIDTKMDDGMPTTGVVRAILATDNNHGGFAINDVAVGANGDGTSCVSTSITPNPYNSNTGRVCSISVQMRELE